MNADKSRVIVTVAPVRIDGARRWHWVVRCSTKDGIKVAEDNRETEAAAWAAAFAEAERVVGIRTDRQTVARTANE